MEALKEIPQIFRNPLTQQTVVDGRKLYVTSQQSLRHHPPPSASAILLL